MIPASRRTFAIAIAIAWGIAALIYLFVYRDGIADHGFPDPDDAMRLQMVRDLLAGQTWFDVGQHRMNAPWGAAMHWSRLVDVPIAALILLLRPLLGPAAAETVTIALVPLLTMLAVMLAIGFAARRLLPPWPAIGAAALVPLTVGAIQQLQPLRIDHHGWQMALAATSLLGLLDADRRRGGLVMGASIAAWLAISLEALPFAAGLGAWLGLRWLRDSRDDRLAWFARGIGLAGLLLHLVFRLPDFGQVACDAFSTIHLLLAFAAWLGIEVAVRFGRDAVARGALLAVTGLACAALYRVGAPLCSAGAFAGMDPLVRDLWYANVREGLPVWQQTLAVGTAGIGYALVGLIGTLLALRRAEPPLRARWADTLAVLAIATAVAVMVQRAGAVAGLLALPGGVALLLAAIAQAQRIPLALLRIPATVLVTLALVPTTPALIAGAIAGSGDGAIASRCATTDNYRSARALPAGSILSDIDIGPGLLIETDHAIVASGHHRNAAGLHDAIAFFVGSPEQARAIVARRGIDYVVLCADLREMTVYAHAAPNGLWAQLRRGRVPGWLERVRLPGSELMLFKVRG